MGMVDKEMTLEEALDLTCGLAEDNCRGDDEQANTAVAMVRAVVKTMVELDIVRPTRVDRHRPVAPGCGGRGATEGEGMMRDPRVDPMPGDIIRFGGRYGCSFHEVLEHDPKFGLSDISSICEGVESQRSMRQWRKFAKGAEVIRVAAPPAAREDGNG